MGQGDEADPGHQSSSALDLCETDAERTASSGRAVGFRGGSDSYNVLHMSAGNLDVSAAPSKNNVNSTTPILLRSNFSPQIHARRGSGQPLLPVFKMPGETTRVTTPGGKPEWMVKREQMGLANAAPLDAENDASALAPTGENISTTSPPEGLALSTEIADNMMVQPLTTVTSPSLPHEQQPSDQPNKPEWMLKREAMKRRASENGAVTSPSESAAPLVSADPRLHISQVAPQENQEAKPEFIARRDSLKHNTLDGATSGDNKPEWMIKRENLKHPGSAPLSPMAPSKGLVLVAAAGGASVVPAPPSDVVGTKPKPSPSSASWSWKRQSEATLSPKQSAKSAITSPPPAPDAVDTKPKPSPSAAVWSWKRQPDASLSPKQTGKAVASLPVPSENVTDLTAATNATSMSAATPSTTGEATSCQNTPEWLLKFKQMNFEKDEQVLEAGGKGDGHILNRVKASLAPFTPNREGNAAPTSAFIAAMNNSMSGLSANARTLHRTSSASGLAGGISSPSDMIQGEASIPQLDGSTGNAPVTGTTSHPAISQTKADTGMIAAPFLSSSIPSTPLTSMPSSVSTHSKPIAGPAIPSTPLTGMPSSASSHSKSATGLGVTSSHLIATTPLTGLPSSHSKASAAVIPGGASVGSASAAGGFGSAPPSLKSGAKYNPAPTPAPTTTVTTAAESALPVSKSATGNHVERNADTVGKLDVNVPVAVAAPTPVAFDAFEAAYAAAQPTPDSSELFTLEDILTSKSAIESDPSEAAAKDHTKSQSSHVASIDPPAVASSYSPPRCVPAVPATTAPSVTATVGLSTRVSDNPTSVEIEIPANAHLTTGSPCKSPSTPTPDIAASGSAFDSPGNDRESTASSPDTFVAAVDGFEASFPAHDAAQSPLKNAETFSDKRILDVPFRTEFETTKNEVDSHEGANDAMSQDEEEVLSRNVATGAGFAERSEDKSGKPKHPKRRPSVKAPNRSNSMGNCSHTEEASEEGRKSPRRSASMTSSDHHEETTDGARRSPVKKRSARHASKPSSMENGSESSGDDMELSSKRAGDEDREHHHSSPRKDPKKGTLKRHSSVNEGRKGRKDARSGEIPEDDVHRHPPKPRKSRSSEALCDEQCVTGDEGDEKKKRKPLPRRRSDMNERRQSHPAGGEPETYENRHVHSSKQKHGKAKKSSSREGETRGMGDRRPRKIPKDSGDLDDDSNSDPMSDEEHESLRSPKAVLKEFFESKSPGGGPMPPLDHPAMGFGTKPHSRVKPPTRTASTRSRNSSDSKDRERSSHQRRSSTGNANVKRTNSSKLKTPRRSSSKESANVSAQSPACSLPLPSGFEDDGFGDAFTEGDPFALSPRKPVGSRGGDDSNEWGQISKTVVPLDFDDFADGEDFSVTSQGEDTDPSENIGDSMLGEMEPEFEDFGPVIKPMSPMKGSRPSKVDPFAMACAPVSPAPDLKKSKKKKASSSKPSEKDADGKNKKKSKRKSTDKEASHVGSSKPEKIPDTPEKLRHEEVEFAEDIEFDFF